MAETPPPSLKAGRPPHFPLPDPLNKAEELKGKWNNDNERWQAVDEEGKLVAFQNGRFNDLLDRWEAIGADEKCIAYREKGGEWTQVESAENPHTPQGLRASGDGCEVSDDDDDAVSSEDEMGDEEAETLRSEVLPHWSVLKEQSVEALTRLCRERKIPFRPRKDWTEEKRHSYFLDKLLQWLKNQEVTPDKVRPPISKPESSSFSSSSSQQQLPSGSQQPASATVASRTSPQTCEGLASRILGLDGRQREMIEKMITMFEEQNKLQRDAEEHLREMKDALEAAEEAERARSAEVEECREKLEKAEKIIEDVRKKTAVHGFMTRAEFARILKEANLLTTCEGAKHEGQHVYHIIATSNGGPDHVDNFLYALGGSFNIQIGDHFDHFNCFIAGKEKSRLAAKVALEVACDEKLHDKIEKRHGKNPTIFTEGRHKELCRKLGDDAEKIGDAL
uniref:Uncharacterized protein n=1 Tax=Chromera velia CCMP2878 TaxID=1169474 RepID=A0A0G4G2F8_9ALVE|mmetsp:Transcript_42578/g.83943  ORF Transcript_42578/g.83943 Transcript_42578/m.83943 type:complete len:450 (-) Transcript_42578:109-1458(-)|eukprot:Cvel_19960.t1-p1 / transcript=Cvel_19960.t1 / gene=Cvel_19960 / organism=Chromera_velia_CCMP2878 / gene_product=hypothetical protein / transcript_product=hypothetical protein / location=Cvel_scaffold1757:22994-24340(-) / protein_length=449 / sequence_SO=supercontig / SO=protein_coding / is_pseudo=false